MKRHGKLLTLVLAVLLAAMLLVSASGLEIFIIASSDEYENYATSAKYLETIDVLKGYDDGELHLEEPILRYQAALFFARVVTGVTDETLWGEGSSKTFTDVPQYGNVIDMIAAMNFIRGYGDGRFGYSDGIMYQDMCAMLVRVLGYETEEMVAAYPMSYVLKVEELGLDLKNVKPADLLNRGQVAQMLYDALVTPIVSMTSEQNSKWEQILTAVNGGQPINDEEDTYLERNFNVSSQMYFQIVATENYRMAGYTRAEKGYFKAQQYKLNAAGTAFETVGTEWTFPIEGEATNGVTEGDLIGRYLTLIFDHKEPTQALFDEEECIIVHAEMATADIYQNVGELSYVHFTDNNAYDTLVLGPKTVKFDNKLDPVLVQYNNDEATVFNTFAVDYTGGTYAKALSDAMDANTYFHIEAYDFNADGEYDRLVFVPYTFGQYQLRTYGGQSYHMVGQYNSSYVYDMTDTTERTDDNKTYFVEKFLGTNAPAGNTVNYTPGNTKLSVSVSDSEYSLGATLKGEEIASGNFMLYNYNKITGELYVAENLGSFQIGVLTGFRTREETFVIDGTVMSVGLPGKISGNTGLLNEETGYALKESEARAIVLNFEKGNNNIKYLEYDGKIVYFESYGSSDVVVSGDYVIVDIDKTMTEHTNDVGASEVWDIPYTADAAVLKTLDPATGDFSEIKVESVTYMVGTTETTQTFDKVDQRRVFGNWTDNTGKNLFTTYGAIYAARDEDEDGLYELHAYGTVAFSSIVGANIQTTPAPEVYFSYNKSNEFMQENAAGILVGRVTTGNSTVSVVIGSDGYIMVKGALGTDSTEEPNKLTLSSAALILEANDEQITIFDPTKTVTHGSATNVYGNDQRSVWYNGAGARVDGVQYYIMLQNSMYNGSEALLDENGDFIKDENGRKLYTHNYRNLYNLVTGATETVQIITTTLTPPAEEVINSVEGVIRVDADNNAATITTFGEVFVKNGDYQYGGFARLYAKDRINFSTQAKAGEPAKSLYYNSDSDLVYQALDDLNITFIDLDGGADVDPDEYSFKDAYVFYQYSDSNAMTYAAVTLTDRVAGQDYSTGTFPVKRHYISKTDLTDRIANGAITNLTAGKSGLIADAGFYRWNGWSDYLIPAVDEDGETIWSYEGSLRVSVTYYAYIDYDEKANTVDAVVVRVGKVGNPIAKSDPDYNTQINKDTVPGDNASVGTLPSDPGVTA